MRAAATVEPQLWGCPPVSRPTIRTIMTFIYLRFQRGVMHYDKGCHVAGLLLTDTSKTCLTATTAE